jgi:hypothetical protein
MGLNSVAISSTGARDQIRSGKFMRSSPSFLIEDFHTNVFFKNQACTYYLFIWCVGGGAIMQQYGC